MHINCHNYQNAVYGFRWSLAFHHLSTSQKYFIPEQYINANIQRNMHSKKCWVVLTQFWVKYGQTQPLSFILNNIFFLPNGWVCPNFTKK